MVAGLSARYHRARTRQSVDGESASPSPTDMADPADWEGERQTPHGLEQDVKRMFDREEQIIQTKRVALDKERRALDIAQREIKHTVSSSNARLRQLEAEVKKLRQEKERLERQLSEEEQRSGDTVSLERENARLLGVVERLTQDKVRLGDVLTKQSNHAKRVGVRNDQLGETVHGLRASNEHQQVQIKRLQGELMRTQKQNAQIKSAHAELERRYETVANNVVDMQHEYIQALEQSDERLHQTQQELAQLSCQDETLRSALAESYQNATVPELKAEISGLKQQLAELSGVAERERVVQAEIDSVKGVLDEVLTLTASRISQPVS
eukprot:TRINITY_DN9642_c0_g1_i1.p1 TRINITY_DN9642_c0_g1~~TRINITY_DN9642_c0_g1_i1.p1  ORF type:complete len:325 (-),score=106.21 TRINITY_DN9642_c0_g1_i1:239-1213(-)